MSTMKENRQLQREITEEEASDIIYPEMNIFTWLTYFPQESLEYCFNEDDNHVADGDYFRYLCDNVF